MYRLTGSAHTAFPRYTAGRMLTRTVPVRANGHLGSVITRAAIAVGRATSTTCSTLLVPPLHWLRGWHVAKWAKASPAGVATGGSATDRHAERTLGVLVQVVGASVRGWP